MPGGWLVRFLPRLVHDVTFEAIVSPAIADLQFESAIGWHARVRGYAAVWRAVAGGICRDLCLDARHMVDEAALLGRLACIQAGYQCFILTLVMDSMSALSSVILVLGVFVVSWVGTLLCFWPARERPLVRGHDAGNPDA